MGSPDGYKVWVLHTGGNLSFSLTFSTPKEPNESSPVEGRQSPPAKQEDKRSRYRDGYQQTDDGFPPYKRGKRNEVIAAGIINSLSGQHSAAAGILGPSPVVDCKEHARKHG